MTSTDLAELQRSRDDAVVAGVCAAVASRLGVDVLLVRVAAVLLALGAGIGVALYAWAWLVLPLAGRRQSLLVQWWPSASQWSPRTHAVIALALAAVTCVLTGLVLPWMTGPAVVVVALVLLQRRSSGPLIGAPRALPDEAPGATAAPLATPVPPAAVPRAATTSPAAAPAAPRTPEPRTPRPRRASWPLGLALLALAALADQLAGGLRTPHPDLLGQAVALAVLGAGLLVAALLRLPRPRLAVLAGILTAVSLCSPAVNGQHNLTARNQQMRPVTGAQLAQLTGEEQTINASTVHYDLTQLDLDEPAAVELQLNASKVVITVPASMPLELHYHLFASNLVITGAGPDIVAAGVTHSTWSTPGTGPTLTLDLTLHGSTVEVHRVTR